MRRTIATVDGLTGPFPQVTAPERVTLTGLANVAMDGYGEVVTTMNVSLPDELRSFVDTQVNEGSDSSTSEYVRELIRRDFDRRQLRVALLEGARGPVTANADAACFASLRDRARATD